jgi:hypothetical protein
MKKLILDLDTLAVDSFETVARREPKDGTVFALATTGAEIICHCTGVDTCDYRCGSGTGGGTTGGTTNTHDETCQTYTGCGTQDPTLC